MSHGLLLLIKISISFAGRASSQTKIPTRSWSHWKYESHPNWLAGAGSDEIQVTAGDHVHDCFHYWPIHAGEHNSIIESSHLQVSVFPTFFIPLSSFQIHITYSSSWNSHCRIILCPRRCCSWLVSLPCLLRANMKKCTLQKSVTLPLWLTTLTLSSKSDRWKWRFWEL